MIIPPISGRGQVPFTINGEVEVVMDMTISPDHDPVVHGVVFQGVGDIEIHRDLVHDLADVWPTIVDQAAAKLLVSLSERTGEISFPGHPGVVATGTMRLADSMAEPIAQEYARRRRARLTDADFQRAADIYRAAAEQGMPVQHVVRFVHDVESADEAIAAYLQNRTGTLSQGGAAKVITECRKRGLLPATTKGKRSV